MIVKLIEKNWQYEFNILVIGCKLEIKVFTIVSVAYIRGVLYGKM